MLTQSDAAAQSQEQLPDLFTTDQNHYKDNRLERFVQAPEMRFHGCPTRQTVLQVLSRRLTVFPAANVTGTLDVPPDEDKSLIGPKGILSQSGCPDITSA